ncbi:MAG: hypothetical protein LBU27_02885 [Candidatus Peribacteria bacterium]|jgi:phosphomannomutase|nr:hypothetical protein [Candidatus Peribacteria bacterium]
MEDINLTDEELRILKAIYNKEKIFASSKQSLDQILYNLRKYKFINVVTVDNTEPLIKIRAEGVKYLENNHNITSYNL